MADRSYTEEDILWSIGRAKTLVKTKDALVGLEVLACELLGVSGDRLYELLDAYGDEQEKELVIPYTKDEEMEL